MIFDINPDFKVEQDIMNSALINRQKRKVKEYMAANDPSQKLSYHNWDHVSFVISAVKDLLAHNNFHDDIKEDLILAAIWHDSDYANGMDGHEQRSADLAASVLKAEGIDVIRIERIKTYILATKMGYLPRSEQEAIIKDADLAHLASSDYLNFYQGLFKEINVLREQPTSADDWKRECLSFLGKKLFFTKEGQKNYRAGVHENIAKLEAMDPNEALNNNSNKVEAEEEKWTKEEKKALKKLKNKHKPKFNTEKGIETMFRVSLRNHITLSRIADDKANTLISVNAIILSIVLSALFPKLDSNPFLVYPGISLIMVSIVTIIIATLSTIPKTTHGEVSRVDVENKKGNLLFFGNFHKMSLEDYTWGVSELMKDGAYLYGSLTRDLYFLGKVLNRKYNLLRYAYMVFVLGLSISIILFVWSIVTLPAAESILPK